MKIDLAGPDKRGLAMGLNEAAGYGAVAATAFATGWIANEWGLRPEPFFLGLAYAGLGLSLSVLFAKATRGHVHHEAANHTPTNDDAHHALTDCEIFTLTSFREKSLSAASQAGLVNNLNDGLAWGLFPIFFAASGLSIGRIGIGAAVLGAGTAIVYPTLLADLISIQAAIYAVAALTAISGAVVITRMYERHPAPNR